MFKSQCMFYLWFCFLIIDTYGSVTFIDKCKFTDKSCLVISSQKAVPYVAAGLPELGVKPLDPLKIDKAVFEEGGLKVVFESLSVTGTSKCKVVNVIIAMHTETEGYLTFEAECPIHVVGNYTASGKLLFAPIEGQGPFLVNTNKLFFSIKVLLKIIQGGDGHKHWKISKPEYTFEVIEKAILNFENLFNGDKEKASPIVAILNESWKDLFQTVGKPIVAKVIDQIIAAIEMLVSKTRASDLQA